MYIGIADLISFVCGSIRNTLDGGLLVLPVVVANLTLFSYLMACIDLADFITPRGSGDLVVGVAST